MGKGNGGGFFAGFLIGAVAGATAAAFLSQEEARNRISGTAREAGERVGDVTAQWQSSVTDLYERGRHVVESAKSNFDAAVAEGQSSAQQTRDDLQRKAEG